MKILIVDDHPLFREGVGMLLSRYDSTIETAFASTVSDALAQAQPADDVDLILLDLGLPDAGGLAGLVRIREACAAIPVVILSAADDQRLILDCLDRGAMGFLTKSSPTEVFRAALKLVAFGGVYVPPQALSAIGVAGPSSHKEAAAIPSISVREAAVLDALIEGQSNKLIARSLGITEHTVKFHVSNILKLLRVQNRTQAVIAAAKLGFRVRRRDATRAPAYGVDGAAVKALT